jgi:hypothetical protein
VPPVHAHDHLDQALEIGAANTAPKLECATITPMAMRGVTAGHGTTLGSAIDENKS